MTVRRLIVNADDFGFTPDVNSGIVEAFTEGILTSTTLMANGPAFDGAVDLAVSHPGLDIGCHLVLIGGFSVADPGKPLPTTLGQFLLRVGAGWSKAAIEEEFCAQIEKIRSAGLTPSHLDTHKHTHLAPPVLDAMLSAARRYGIKWIRRPFDLPLTAARAGAGFSTRMIQRGLSPLRRRFTAKLEASGARATDAFAGFQLTGRFRAVELSELIAALPEGSTEFMCHPGHCRDELLAAPTRLKQSREIELRALTSDQAIRALEASNIELTSYRDI